MEEKKFTWVETHKQLVEYLKTKENSQSELIELLKFVGITPFNDKDSSGSDIELDEIDPFTFFCYIYKYGSQKRLKLLQKIAKKLNLIIPEDEKGLPSASARKVWLFPYKKDRVNNEIQRLWSFFKRIVESEIEDADFQDILSIKNVGKTKLTEVLFYVKPDKYLPINGPTKKYLKEKFGIDPSFETYAEYVELLNKVKEETKISFYELSYDAWKWHETLPEINYWIFQGNPNVFETAIRQGVLTNWTVSAHKNEIKTGDKVIFWITGKKAGCYALGKITSEPYHVAKSPDDHLWKEEDKHELKADVRITHNLVDTPILKDQIAEIEELSDLKVGTQGTNFRATEEEFDTLLNMANQILSKRKYWIYAPGEKASMWEEFYELGIMALGWDELGDLNDYQAKDEIAERLREIEGTTSSKKNDATANYEFKNVMSIGDIVIPKRGIKEYLGYGVVTSDYYYDETRESYKSCRRVDWKKKRVWKDPKGNIVVKTLTDITKNLKLVEMLKKMIGIEELKVVPKPIISKINYPLNTIFYGPPGTGKTYKTILRAAEIVENRKIESYDEALKIFRRNLHDRIEFITFHQNFSYEDFIQGLRPDTDNDKGLNFKKVDGIFKKIADRARNNDAYYLLIGTKLGDYTVIKSNSDIIELKSKKTESIRYVPQQLVVDLIGGIKSNKISLEDIKRRQSIDLPKLIGSKVERYFFGIESSLGTVRN